MAIRNASPEVSEGTRAGLEQIANGPLADRLRASLRRRHPRRSADEIAEAFQEAYLHALRSCPVEDEPAIYAWLWRTMDNVLVDRLRLLAREAPASDTDGPFGQAADLEATPEREVERAEEQRELGALFETVAGQLAPRQRAVLGLYVRGLKRPQVAQELGLSQRIVKRDLERILASARTLLVERCGGGCPEGSRVVWRFAFGLASSRESAQAQLHLVSCPSCQKFLARLGSWREAAAAAVPLPAAEPASQDLLERAVHGLADIGGSARERIGSSATAVRQQVAEAAGQLKQQSVSVYYRAVDPTPMAGMRPGAAAAAIGTCLALGAGATYCVDRGVPAMPDLTGLIQQQDGHRKHRQRDRAATAQVDPSPDSSQPPPTTSTPEPAPQPTQPAPQPVVQTTSQPPPAPPPEQEQFDPAAAAAAQSAEPASASTAKPAGAAKSGVGEFLGGP